MLFYLLVQIQYTLLLVGIYIINYHILTWLLYLKLWYFKLNQNLKTINNYCTFTFLLVNCHVDEDEVNTVSWHGTTRNSNKIHNLYCGADFPSSSALNLVTISSSLLTFIRSLKVRSNSFLLFLLQKRLYYHQCPFVRQLISDQSVIKTPQTS